MQISKGASAAGGGWFELIDAAKVETSRVVKSSRGQLRYKLINCTTKNKFAPHGYLHAEIKSKRLQ